MKSLTSLLDKIPVSPTIAVTDKAQRMIADGQDVIALAGGEPDFDTPSHIIDSGISAIRNGKTHYAAPAKGINPLLEAVANKLTVENGILVNPKTDIVVTPGAKWSLHLALRAILNPGDEVIYLEPAWVSYAPMIILNGGTPVAVALNRKDNYTITAELLREKITPNTKAIMINSPCNPTGRVLTQTELEAIAAVALESDLYIIADEIYEKLVFDNHKHVSIGSLPDMAERTLTINGFSKGYAMTGWRLGWLAGPTPIMKLAAKVNSQTITSAATFTMHAGAAALSMPQDIVSEMTQAYQGRRDFMVQALNEIDGIECDLVEGAFYLMPAFPNSTKNSLEIADALLEKALIAGIPGSAFGNASEGLIRFSIATEMSLLEKAVERLQKVVPML